MWCCSLLNLSHVSNTYTVAMLLTVHSRTRFITEFEGRWFLYLNTKFHMANFDCSLLALPSRKLKTPNTFHADTILSCYKTAYFSKTCSYIQFQGPMWEVVVLLPPHKFVLQSRSDYQLYEIKYVFGKVLNEICPYEIQSKVVCWF
jgi:hypothetical protein